MRLLRLHLSAIHNPKSEIGGAAKDAKRILILGEPSCLLSRGMMEAIKDPSYAKESDYFVLVVDANYNNIVKVDADSATNNLTKTIQLNLDIAIYSRGGGTPKKKKNALTSWGY